MYYMFSSNNASKQFINSNQQPIEVYPLPKNTGYAIQVSDSIKEIQNTWDAVAPKENLFLQSAYLQTLEDFPPKKMSFKYVIFYHNDHPIGIAYHQVFRLNVEESLQQNTDEENNQSNCIIRAFSNAIKKWFIKRAEFNLLICGNLLLTGEYGFHFNQKMEDTKAAVLIQDSLDLVQTILDKEQTKISVHLLKDYKVETCDQLKKQLQKETYHPFLMQPSMYMNIRPHWESFENYLADMSSKYRVRAKRARKKGSAIIKKELNLEEIEANEERIHELYKMIADGAGFNAFLLHPKYFTELKRSLGDRYKLTAYFIDDHLVAFYTAIFNYDEMDAHFLGVDGNYNREHQVYLNILYDLVNRAIEGGVKNIDFARTALEIKSSVGAVSQDMLCFFKHRNTLSSKVLQFVFDSLNPKEEWQPRSPFKANTAPVV
ncbi:GNAT family N-acetyltransferase [Aureispira anguillae]|uniref:GNAT family N-acetyltransferase n=1 Tax=Aureispira anguillae TaxID=2864201 RepID=A0A915YK45_9BACT|nr:GNAT family N-acetyltransferase [Aureispira anguillae]BDS14422.1 GNAT family N-acetyltransferase [Aureispira anguillae]